MIWGAAVGIVAEEIVQYAKDSEINDFMEIGKQALIGSASGGLGGKAGQFVGKAVKAMTKPASAMGKGASKVLTEGTSGAVAGAVTGGSNNALNQFVDTGTVDGGQVMEASLSGAVGGAASGAGTGLVQASAAKKTLGHPRAVPMFSDSVPSAQLVMPLVT